MSIHLEQAVPQAIADLLISRLDLLNAAFAADSLLASLAYPIPDITSDAVIVADAMDVWKITDNRLRILVSPGHYRTGQVVSTQRVYVDGSSPGAGISRTYATDVACHFHPDLFSVQNHVAQSQKRVRAQSIVAGWLDWDVLNSPLSADLRLESDEFRNSTVSPFVEPAFYPQDLSTPYPYAGLPITDHLILCYCTGISRGVAQLGFAGTQTCYCVSATHQGLIY